jgi:ribonuclease BN (tRNA processing enzyme)
MAACLSHLSINCTNAFALSEWWKGLPIEPAVGYRVEAGGVAVVVSGDTRVCAGIEALARTADVLTHEAVRSDAASPALLAWNAGRRVGR